MPTNPKSSCQACLKGLLPRILNWRGGGGILLCRAVPTGPGEFLQTGTGDKPPSVSPPCNEQGTAHRDLARLCRATKGKRGWGWDYCAKMGPRPCPALGRVREQAAFWLLPDWVGFGGVPCFAAGFHAHQAPCVPEQDMSSADGSPRGLPRAQGAHPPPSPLSFPPTVTSEQIEHLHRRFKQLSRDQLTIRYGASIATAGAIPVPPGAGQSIARGTPLPQAGEGALAEVPAPQAARASVSFPAVPRP